MKVVLAAIDNSLAGKPVIAAARALAAVLGAGVAAVHVAADGHRTAQSAAAVAGVPLRTVTGRVVAALVAAGESPDVVAMSIGARGTPAGPLPLGGTAAAVATRLLKPVVVVPPDAVVAETFRRVLVPLEAAFARSRFPGSVYDVAGEYEIEVVALHVLDEASIPAFTDQPQHEQTAWTREFLARYCPHGLGRVRLETRVGRTEELVAAVAEQCGCDLISLGWSQELAPGRATVVRETLSRTRLPVLLTPVRSGEPGQNPRRSRSSASTTAPTAASTGSLSGAPAAKLAPSMP
jgi:nucleotide-binding universal stress UspA family protein